MAKDEGGGEASSKGAYDIIQVKRLTGKDSSSYFELLKFDELSILILFALAALVTKFTFVTPVTLVTHVTLVAPVL